MAESLHMKSERSCVCARSFVLRTSSMHDEATSLYISGNLWSSLQKNVDRRHGRSTCLVQHFPMTTTDFEGTEQSLAIRIQSRECAAEQAFDFALAASDHHKCGSEATRHLKSLGVKTSFFISLEFPRRRLGRAGPNRNGKGRQRAAFRKPHSNQRNERVDDRGRTESRWTGVILVFTKGQGLAVVFVDTCCVVPRSGLGLSHRTLSPPWWCLHGGVALHRLHTE